MYKELVISIILVILIVIGDLITQNYTKKNVSFFTSELEILKQSLINKDSKTAQEEAEKISNKWEQVHEKLAYYIEHDELEKVETDFTACKSFINTGNYDLAMSELDKTVFVLEHITDKYSFNLQNIF